MDNLELLIPRTAPSTDDYWTWATVQDSTTQIRLDGEVAVLDATPEFLYANPAIGDRVWVQLTGRRVIVHSRHNGELQDSTVTTAKIADSAVTSAKIADGTISIADLAAAVSQALSPTGAITAYAGATAPAGWLKCDNAAVSRTTYAGLFAVIGTTYGAGNGSTTFNVPHLIGRVPVGIWPGGDARLDTLGKYGGEVDHALSIAEMPSHNHDFEGQTIYWGGGQTGTVRFVPNTTNNYVQAVASGTANNDVYTRQGTGGWTDTYYSGSGAQHNNMQPFLVTNYIIKT